MHPYAATFTACLAKDLRCSLWERWSWDNIILNKCNLTVTALIGLSSLISVFDQCLAYVWIVSILTIYCKWSLVLKRVTAHCPMEIWRNNNVIIISKWCPNIIIVMSCVRWVEFQCRRPCTWHKGTYTMNKSICAILSNDIHINFFFLISLISCIEKTQCLSRIGIGMLEHQNNKRMKDSLNMKTIQNSMQRMNAKHLWQHSIYPMRKKIVRRFCWTY